MDLSLNLPDPATHVETTGYIAWADALGRAGVRFSELPEESRQRLEQWLALHAAAPSRNVPTLSLIEPVLLRGLPIPLKKGPLSCGPSLWRWEPLRRTKRKGPNLVLRPRSSTSSIRLGQT